MWDAFCEHLRKYGRSGNLFVLICTSIATAALFGPVAVAALLGLLGAYLVWFCVEVRQQQVRFERLGQQPPLASVDLRVARVRLANSKTQRLQAEQSRRLKTERFNRPVTSATHAPLRLRMR